MTNRITDEIGVNQQDAKEEDARIRWKMYDRKKDARLNWRCAAELKMREKEDTLWKKNTPDQKKTSDKNARFELIRFDQNV